MNYIGLINQFWLLDEEHLFNGNETRLYFFLLKKSNSLRWKNPFTNADTHTAAAVGVSINTLKTIRNKLKQVGLIDFKTGGNGARNKCEYTIMVSNIDTLSDTFPDTLSDESLTPNPGKIDDINKHKNKDKPNTTSKEGAGSENSDGSDEQKPGNNQVGKAATIPEPFLQAHKTYFSGKKRSVETEFEHLKKKIADYKQVIDLLPVAVENFKRQMEQEKRESSKIKHMQGWISDRQWEKYATAEPEMQQNSEEIKAARKEMVL